MSYKQRDILLVPIPFTDLTASKKRPVVVLSNNRYNTAASDIVVAAITSNLTEKMYTVPIDTANLETGVMPKPSVVRADKIYTLSDKIVSDKFGKIDEVTFSQVVENITSILKNKEI